MRKDDAKHFTGKGVNMIIIKIAMRYLRCPSELEIFLNITLSTVERYVLFNSTHYCREESIILTMIVYLVSVLGNKTGYEDEEATSEII